MKQTINFEGPILTGSISTAMSKCGKEVCACKAKQPKLHGPYYRWTGFIDGKRTTRTISQTVALECARRIKRYKSLKNKIDQILETAAQKAPWFSDE